MIEAKYTSPDGAVVLYHADAIDVLPQLASASVDAVVTDPPYYNGLHCNGVSSRRGDSNISIPFFRQYFAEIKRACKSCRAVYVFTDWRTNDFFMRVMSEFMEVKNSLVWLKNLGTGYTYQNSYESILFHCESGRKIISSNVINGIKSFNGGAKKTNGERVHPTQKPVELIEKLILDSTQAGMTVLDTFMGSGTTAIGCIRQGRKFIGCEVDAHYFDIAVRRIETELAQRPFPEMVA